VQSPENSLIKILKKNAVDFVCSLPCEKIKNLLERISRDFFHIPLTREEEGVGISAGLALAGKRPAMFVQSSGIGNMINALLSLTSFYELPLAIFVSQRGIYKEKIPAQVPMGKRLPKILKGASIPYSVISKRSDFRIINEKLPDVYRRNTIHLFLLSPAIFKETGDTQTVTLPLHPLNLKTTDYRPTKVKPRLARYEVLKTMAPFIDSRVVICNLGVPSKELFHIKHQPSNFYMLGSMGMATPIGLGISLSTDRETVVIDGDGSILMNPGSIATTAYCAPPHLTICAIDNSSYGSTGNQPTLTGSCADLGLLAKSLGFKQVIRVATKKQLVNELKRPCKELRFLHVLALPGNEDVPNIPVHHLEVKKTFMNSLKSLASPSHNLPVF
jgi:sulfopyruvate decarboxylase subunit beta